jgi:hypothetical protein
MYPAVWLVPDADPSEYEMYVVSPVCSAALSPMPTTVDPLAITWAVFDHMKIVGSRNLVDVMFAAE